MLPVIADAVGRLSIFTGRPGFSGKAHWFKHMLSLIYVSRPLVEPGDCAKALYDIQAVSIARNSTLDITGLLISTIDYFAQLLEGPAVAVNAVMASIMIDPRHHEVRVIRRSEVGTRRFPHWRMARFDGESFGSVRANPLLAACHHGDEPAAIVRLERLIDAIAISQAAARPQGSALDADPSHGTSEHDVGRP